MNWENKLLQQLGSAHGHTRWPVQMPPLISAHDLQRTEFPPISWLVRDMIPEGLTILAGKPKLGKSWLALDIGYAVATGGEVLGRQVEEGRVLYAALEDNRRRLKSRLQKMVPNSTKWPDRLELAVEWDRLDVGGLAAIEAWVDAYTDARLVIIDTLATVRPQADSRNSPYQNDYAAMRGLHALANSRGIAILVVHHVRKADADDPFDTVSGSTGLTGAADATIILTNTTDGNVLYGRGRDLQEFEAAVDFDPIHCRWADLGRPSDAHGSETRKAIRVALRAGRQTPKDIAEEAGLDYDLCQKTLVRMADGGEIQKGGRGRYRLAPDPLAS